MNCDPIDPSIHEDDEPRVSRPAPLLGLVVRAISSWRAPAVAGPVLVFYGLNEHPVRWPWWCAAGALLAGWAFLRSRVEPG